MPTGIQLNAGVGRASNLIGQSLSFIQGMDANANMRESNRLKRDKFNEEQTTASRERTAMGMNSIQADVQRRIGEGEQGISFQSEASKNSDLLTNMAKGVFPDETAESAFGGAVESVTAGEDGQIKMMVRDKEGNLKDAGLKMSNEEYWHRAKVVYSGYGLLDLKSHAAAMVPGSKEKAAADAQIAQVVQQAASNGITESDITRGQENIMHPDIVIPGIPAPREPIVSEDLSAPPVQEEQNASPSSEGGAPAYSPRGEMYKQREATQGSVNVTGVETLPGRDPAAVAQNAETDRQTEKRDDFHGNAAITKAKRAKARAKDKADSALAAKAARDERHQEALNTPPNRANAASRAEANAAGAVLDTPQEAGVPADLPDNVGSISPHSGKSEAELVGDLADQGLPYEDLNKLSDRVGPAQLAATTDQKVPVGEEFTTEIDRVEEEEEEEEYDDAPQLETDAYLKDPEKIPAKATSFSSGGKTTRTSNSSTVIRRQMDSPRVGDPMKAVLYMYHMKRMNGGSLPAGAVKTADNIASFGDALGLEKAKLDMDAAKLDYYNQKLTQTKGSDAAKLRKEQRDVNEQVAKTRTKWAGIQADALYSPRPGAKSPESKMGRAKLLANIENGMLAATNDLGLGGMDPDRYTMVDNNWRLMSAATGKFVKAKMGDTAHNLNIKWHDIFTDRKTTASFMSYFTKEIGAAGSDSASGQRFLNYLAVSKAEKQLGGKDAEGVEELALEYLDEWNQPIAE